MTAIRPELGFCGKTFPVLKVLSDAAASLEGRDGIFAALVSSLWHGKIPQDRYIEEVHGIPGSGFPAPGACPRAGQAPGFWI
ncbi:MAG TPA: hypothetical protein VFC11_08700 [Methylocella sp.]|nr:hypothetical protein [Methylocella sp.]